MARGSLGRLPLVLKAENKIGVFDGEANPLIEFTPAFDANGVSFGNYSDNHVQISMMIKDEAVVILLPPNSSEAYNFAKGIIGSIKMIAVREPVKSGGGIIDASELTPVVAAAAGYVDINLIREQ